MIRKVEMQVSAENMKIYGPEMFSNLVKTVTVLNTLIAGEAFDPDNRAHQHYQDSLELIRKLRGETE